MPRNRTVTYADSGVDITANDRLIDLIKPIARSTARPQVLGGIGGFAGLFRLNQRSRMSDPVLVGCTDGVGSKILVAIETNRLDTVGIDLVAMNVNDLITVGAEPLFFLDYVAVHKLVPRRVAQVVQGIADGCQLAQCALLGGETAEMPDLYQPGHLDLAGFAVGVVDRKQIIDGSQVHHGDVLIGLPSSGLHSNGYSLARHLVFKKARLKPSTRVPGIGPIAKELLKPTCIYVKPILALLKRPVLRKAIHAMAHITGGGLPGNLVRVLPSGCEAAIDTHAWDVPPIFTYLQSLGVQQDEMYRVFNMGIGMVLVAAPTQQKAIIRTLQRHQIAARVIGTIRKGTGGVVLQDKL